jgi:hypothetical protein
MPLSANEREVKVEAKSINPRREKSSGFKALLRLRVCREESVVSTVSKEKKR